MKYISIDLETTGLNPEKHQILTFSGILEDTSKVLPFEEIPKFNIYILRDDITGSPFAINMNSEIIERIATYLNTRDTDARMIQRQIVDGVFLYEYEVTFYFYLWCLVHQEERSDLEHLLHSEEWGSRKNPLISEISEIRYTNSKIGCNAAGKNFSSFDKRFLDKIDKLYDFVYFRQRVLDPSALYIDWDNDQTSPDLSTCKRRAGLDDFVSHDSIDDAWDVVELFRKHYKK
jgi:oligoribonuclease (3'-5' exoribonuclease)